MEEIISNEKNLADNVGGVVSEANTDVSEHLMNNNTTRVVRQVRADNTQPR